ncbi:hypothetical protein [Candidatus Methylopumilus universalis]|uniref:hypothetical protein n=1 Tax=Candidatus Methylopumilus universalis TaxID=2588536 RepID=UPI0011211267|nr:hypothetical protein [Candidatus Methylopumilus universalis]QDC72506.1 hypothetical protein FIT75_06825 [Candidatus Methylopumilus universalis]
MNKLLLVISLLFITNFSYSKDIDLLCRGTYTYVSKNVDDKRSKDINFTFDDVTERIATESNLFCLNSEGLKLTNREFSKKRIYSSSKTDVKEPKDVGYCSHSFDLNRHSGKLETTKMENYEGIVVIQNGIFNCELAKQKF